MFSRNRTNKKEKRTNLLFLFDDFEEDGIGGRETGGGVRVVLGHDGGLASLKFQLESADLGLPSSLLAGVFCVGHQQRL